MRFLFVLRLGTAYSLSCPPGWILSRVVPHIGTDSMYQLGVLDLGIYSILRQEVTISICIIWTLKGGSSTLGLTTSLRNDVPLARNLTLTMSHPSTAFQPVLISTRRLYFVLLTINHVKGLWWMHCGISVCFYDSRPVDLFIPPSLSRKWHSPCHGNGVLPWTSQVIEFVYNDLHALSTD